MSQLFQKTGKALGSEVTLSLVVETWEQGEILCAQLWQQIDEFERRFSRFQPESELSLFNQKSGSWTPISSQFFDLLHTAQAYSQATDGLYTPFILPALQKAGYKGSWPLTSQLKPASDLSERVLSQIDQLELADLSARIPKNSAIEFGGIGKGYLLDQLAASLTSQVRGYWLSLGGDILCKGHDQAGQNWSIGIAHATNGSIIGTVTNPTGEPLAIATSGITKRKGMYAGEEWHHLIDPRTGKPAQTNLLTATVCTATATSADVYAKCLVILSSKQASSYINRKTILSSVLQSENGIITQGDLITLS